MRWIAIKVMQFMLNKGKNDRDNCKETVIKNAFNVMIENYETTIIFLKANGSK